MSESEICLKPRVRHFMEHTLQNWSPQPAGYSTYIALKGNRKVPLPSYPSCFKKNSEQFRSFLFQTFPKMQYLFVNLEVLPYLQAAVFQKCVLVSVCAGVAEWAEEQVQGVQSAVTWATWLLCRSGARAPPLHAPPSTTLAFTSRKKIVFSVVKPAATNFSVLWYILLCFLKPAKQNGW